MQHANPISGWSRTFTGLPLIILAAWSRVWLGWWALLLAAVFMLWLWINPRLFSPPADDRAWMTRGVMGERLWTLRNELSLPETRTAVPHVLNAVAGIGALIMVYGLVVLDPLYTLIGAAISWTGKFCFIGRCAALYDSVAARDRAFAYRPPE